MLNIYMKRRFIWDL